jgi:tRNA pseudouridine55 synthase
MGEVLGCGAHVAKLHRTAVAPYLSEKMHTFSELEALVASEGRAALKPYLLPMETAVQSLPAVYLPPASVFYVRMGQAVMAHQVKNDGFIRIFADSGEFLGLGEMLDDGRLTPKRLLAQQ